jgi:hypothetical protein
MRARDANDAHCGLVCAAIQEIAGDASRLIERKKEEQKKKLMGKSTDPEILGIAAQKSAHPELAAEQMVGDWRIDYRRFSLCRRLQAPYLLQ